MLLRLTPWRRGPLLLLRRPGVALALVAAAFVAALPAAAAPLFLSSAQNATLHRQITETCPWRGGVRITNDLRLMPQPSQLEIRQYGPASGIGPEVFDRRNRVAANAAAAGLGAQVTTLIAEFDAVPLDHRATEANQGLNLIGQDVDDFAGHLQVLEGPAGAGLWVPDTFARVNQLKVGDRVRLTARPASHVLIPWLDPGQKPTSHDTTVAAVFRDLRSLPDQPYWCTLRDYYRGVPGQEFSNTPILPMALIDTKTFLAAGTANHIRTQHTIEYAVAEPAMHATEAARVATGIARMKERVYRDDPQVLSSDFGNRTGFESWLSRHVSRADLVRDGILPPVVPITAAGVLVGLAVVAAAAAFWVQRRRQELTVLAAHGVGASGLGLKAVTESLPAVLVGAAAGWAGALALVRYTGPGAILSPEALPLATVAAGATTLVTLALIGAVAAGRARALTDQAPVTHAARWWRRLHWEFVPLAAAPVAWVTMADGATVDAAGGVGEVAHVPARLLVVPILAIAGVAVLAGRLLAGRLRARGLRRTPARPASLLAWRRIVRDATTTAMLVGATAVPIAMATYGASVTDSIRTTADAEVRMVLGSDVVATLERGAAQPALPDDLARRTTEVVRIDRQSLDGLTVDVLVVDPETVERGAFWDDRIDGPTLAEAVGRLSAGPVARVVASDRAALGPARLRGLVGDLPVEVVDVRPLPGVQGGYPVVLLHRDAIDTSQPHFVHQLWIRGEPAELHDEVVAARLPLARLNTIDELRAGSVHEPVTFTFQYLIALSVFTGLIAVVGLLLYLESRTATHRRAYVLLRRFGLRAGAHRRALLLELAAPVLGGLVGGLALAGALAYALGDAFEINKTEPPGTVLVLPVVMVAVVAVTAAIVATGAAALAHRRVSRANPSEVLRDTP